MKSSFFILLASLAVVPATHADGDGQTLAVYRSAPYGADGQSSHAIDLVLGALAYIGTRYRYGGNSPATGFDCSGLVWRVFKQVAGMNLPHDSRQISRIGERISRDELEPGDLVFFNTMREPFSHVGIYLGAQRFIHAPRRGGHVEIVNMSGEYWRKRYDGARRILISR